MHLTPALTALVADGVHSALGSVSIEHTFDAEGALGRIATTPRPNTARSAALRDPRGRGPRKRPQHVRSSPAFTPRPRRRSPLVGNDTGLRRANRAGAECVRRALRAGRGPERRAL